MSPASPPPAPADLLRAGLTEAEARAWEKLGAAAAALLALPELHPMEREEACHALHRLQDYLLSRPAMRSLGWPD